MRVIPDLEDAGLIEVGAVAHDYMLYPDLAASTPQLFYDKSMAAITNAMGKMAIAKGISLNLSPQQLGLMLNHPAGDLHEDGLKRYNYSRYAGKILLDVWRLDEGGLEGSINKSIHLVEVAGGVSCSFLRKVWSTYKSVAHFCAANYILDQDDPPVGLGIEYLGDHQADRCPGVWRHSRDFLALAAFFYAYGTERVEPRTRSRLLPPEDTWAVPTRPQLETEYVILDSPVTDGEKTVLENYKANSRY
ncbi:hypothetical protein [Humidesulfovibrio idahonensis]